MTVATELAKRNQKMEYLLCIEGIGWPVDYDALSSGFKGTVFATNDIAGTLESDVTFGTIHYGLELPKSLSDNFDIKTNEYSPGNLNFTIQETEDADVESIFRPHVDDKKDVLEDDLKWGGTSIKIDNADNTWANGDVAWVAGREALLLSAKALDAGTVYSYTVERGYLGTPRAKYNPRAVRATDFYWPADTVIYDHNKFFFNRRVILLAHVPGESTPSYLYFGRLKGFSAIESGTKWTFSTIADDIIGHNRMKESPRNNHAEFISHHTWDPRDVHTAPAFGSAQKLIYAECYRDPPPDDLDTYGVAFAYNYRVVKGGTYGVYYNATSTPASPQAYEDTNGYLRLDCIIKIGDKYLKALHATPNTADTYRYFYTEVFAFDTERDSVRWEDALPVKFLIDNFSDVWPDNRYSVNKVPSRNVVDFLLFHLTTMNSEFYIGNSFDPPGTSSAIKFVISPSWTVNEWAGYALHCTDPDDSNWGESRTITSNTADTITVDRAFTNAPGTSKQYQIRNSIYDVLPIGWGLSVPNNKIDIDAIETMRDRFFGGVNIGRFAMGDTEGYDLWQVLKQNICQPYGILPYIDRTTGKLTMQHVGELIPDGLITDYVEITTDDLAMTNGIGDIKYNATTPVNQIELSVRDRWSAPLRPVYERNAVGNMQQVAWKDVPQTSIGIKDADHSITIKPADSEVVYEGDTADTLNIKAMFNSEDDSAFITAEMIARLNRYRVPYPTTTIKINNSFLLGTDAVHPGTILSITDTTKYNPIDPFSGGRGWAAQAARVTSINYNFNNNTMDCEVVLLPLSLGSRIAPAANITSKSSDGNGAYLVVNPTDFVLDEESDKDYYKFAVDDIVQIRNQSGSVDQSGLVITGFGTNFVSDPEDANSDRIYVDAAISATIGTGEYVTFDTWSNSNSDNMDEGAALADSNEVLGAGNDTGKIYT